MGPPRSDAVGHHALVKFAEIEAVADSGRILTSKFERGDLAEKIAAVRWIVGAAHRFLPRGRPRQVRLALEELRGLVDRPRAAVHPNPGDQPADARQRFADLRQPVPRVVFLETFVADELLRVVRPTILPRRRLRERIEPDPDAPDLSRRAAHEETMYIVSRRDLVRRDVGQRRDVEFLQP